MIPPQNFSKQQIKIFWAINNDPYFKSSAKMTPNRKHESVKVNSMLTFKSSDTESDGTLVTDADLHAEVSVKDFADRDHSTEYVKF